jgi:Cu/Ag efflux protein CusF
MNHVTRISAILAISAATFGLAHAQSTAPSPSGSSSSPASSSSSMPSKPAGGAKSEMGEGVVKSVDAATGTVTFASGQTMKLKDPGQASKLKEGQIIEYRTESGSGGPVIVSMKVLG